MSPKLYLFSCCSRHKHVCVPTYLSFNRKLCKQLSLAQLNAVWSCSMPALAHEFLLHCSHMSGAYAICMSLPTFRYIGYLYYVYTWVQRTLYFILPTYTCIHTHNACTYLLQLYIRHTNYLNSCVGDNFIDSVSFLFCLLMYKICMLYVYVCMHIVCVYNT